VLPHEAELVGEREKSAKEEFGVPALPIMLP